MEISREEVLHVARLARLALTDEEVDRFRGQLSAILEAVGKVSELDLDGIPPTSHPLDLVNVLAEDEPRPSLHARGRTCERARSRGWVLRSAAGMTRFCPGPGTDACVPLGQTFGKGASLPLGGPRARFELRPEGARP